MPQPFKPPIKLLLGIGLVLPGLLLSGGCRFEQQSSAQGQPPGRGQKQGDQPPLVDVAVAEVQTATDDLSYTGSTSPIQTVSLRSRVEGQLLTLRADVGDGVSRGEVLAQLDQDLVSMEIGEAEAELAARQFEVEQAKAQLGEARTQVEQARALLRQAQADADRLSQLAKEGAVSLQDGELAQTNLRTAEQVLKSAQEQVQAQERAVASVERRVAVQAAILDQAQERSAYATLQSPLTGVVLSRSAEPGDLIQAGQVLLEIGDLSALHVYIQVSDRDLSQFALGQAVQVTLDAFPQQTFRGEVTQISPVADATARLIPLEITIPNPGSKIGSGLMARVAVATIARQTVKVPETALQQTEGEATAILFVPRSAETETSVEARTVQVGKRDNGLVEILSGLEPGEAFIFNSDRPLETGQTVRRSFLSKS